MARGQLRIMYYGERLNSISHLVGALFALVAFGALLALGIQQPTGFYLDYFPVIPRFGVVLLGIGVGNLLYTDDRVPALFRQRPSWAMPTVGLQWLGQHSLVIYLLHQPILFGVLWVLYG